MESNEELRANQEGMKSTMEVGLEKLEANKQELSRKLATANEELRSIRVCYSEL